MTADTTRTRLWLALSAIVLTGAVACLLFVRLERFFPYWDRSLYADETLRLAGAFSTSTRAGLEAIQRSLSSDYNLLFAVPLVPWTFAFGESRLIFVLSLYLTYFLPFLLCATTLGRTLLPHEPRRAAITTAFFLVATPAAWYHVAWGYPDIGGAALVTAAVLAYTRLSQRPVLAGLLTGLLLGLAVVFRRHYVYAVAALTVAMVIEIVVAAIRRRLPRPAVIERLRIITSAMVATTATIAAVTPHILRAAIGEFNGRRLFESWEYGAGHTFLAIIETVGLVPLVLACGGWIAILSGRGGREHQLVLLATIVWIVLWTMLGRQEPFHYPHWIPLFVGVGLAILWMRTRWIANHSRRRLAEAGLAATTAAAVILGFPLTLPTGVDSRNPYPMRLFPDPIRPTVHPAYEGVQEVVKTLRSVATSSDPIVVAASSTTLNGDVLRAAEAMLYGRNGQRLAILSTPQADSYGVLPVDDLLTASLVVLATPFQFHLEPDQQDVVRVLVEAFDKRWPVAGDFTQIGPVISLGDIDVRIQRRIRETTPDVALDTAQRTERFVYGSIQTFDLSDRLSRLDLPRPATVEIPLALRNKPMEAAVQCRNDSVNGVLWSAEPTPLSTTTRGAVISGWIIDARTKGSGQEAFIRLQSTGRTYYVPAARTSRPDIVDAFADTSYERSGYMARLALSSVEPGRYSVTSLLSTPDRVLVCENTRDTVIIR